MTVPTLADEMLPLAEQARKHLEHWIAASKRVPLDNDLLAVIEQAAFTALQRFYKKAGLVKQVDTEGLNPSARARDGSNPSPRTTLDDELAALRRHADRAEELQRWHEQEGDAPFAAEYAADAAALRSALARLEAMQWRGIGDAPNGGDVWVFGGALHTPTIARADGEWWRYMKARETLPEVIPTHWMPLPSPPEPQEGE